MSASSFWMAVVKAIGQFVSDGPARDGELTRGRIPSAYRSRAGSLDPNSALSSNRRVRPSGAAPIGVLGPWRGRQVAAVDRRAAGGIGDYRAVAEQLRDQFEIRSLAAARAGARELEQRLLDLLLADARVLDLTRSSSGIFRKKSQFSRSGSRSGGCATMLIAFRRVSLLFLAGQTSTQTPHPVQSSGATWIVYFMPCPFFVANCRST
jgi:hypothetical protein